MEQTLTPAGLDPRMLAQLEGLELRARRLVEGLVTGMHRSPYRGVSVEFVEHRKYSQGDDLKHLDWKVYGRSDKHYIKQYEQESNLRMMLLVDSSESMTYRSDPRGLSKFEYAATLAAGMAYLILQQTDAVGMAMFDESPGRLLPASNRRGQFHAIVHVLETAQAGGRTRIRQVLESLAEKLTHRHLVVLASDLFDNTDGIMHGLGHLRHRRHETIVLHVMDHAELEFPFTQRTLFRGLEGFAPITTEPRAIRERYLEEVQKFRDRVRKGCHELLCDYWLFDTSMAIDVALSNYLATRAQRSG